MTVEALEIKVSEPSMEGVGKFLAELTALEARLKSIDGSSAFRVLENQVLAAAEATSAGTRGVGSAVDELKAKMRMMEADATTRAQTQAGAAANVIKAFNMLAQGIPTEQVAAKMGELATITAVGFNGQIEQLKQYQANAKGLYDTYWSRIATATEAQHIQALEQDASFNAKKLAAAETAAAKLDAAKMAEIDRQRLMDTNFYDASLPAQLAAAEKAKLFSVRGGNATSQFGAAAAGADIAAIEAQIAALKKLDAANGVHIIGMGSNLAKTEVVRVGVDVLNGSYGRMERSLFTLGTSTGWSTLLFSAQGFAIAAVTAAVAGFFYALYSGSKEQEAMNNALALTNNYAGTTSDGLMHMAEAATAAGGSLSVAKDAVTALAASGRFTSEEIAKVTQASVDMNTMTGASVKDTVKQFEELAKSPVESILKLNETYHFLTAAVLVQIETLQRHGDAIGASKLAIDTFAKAVHDKTPEIVANMGFIERAATRISNEFHKFVQGFADIGKDIGPIDTVTNAYTRLRRAQNAAVGLGVSQKQHDDAVTAATAAVEAAIKANTDLRDSAILAGEATQQRAKQDKAVAETMAYDASRKHSQSLQERQDAQTVRDALIAKAIATDQTHNADLAALGTAEAIAQRHAEIAKQYAESHKAGANDAYRSEQKKAETAFEEVKLHQAQILRDAKAANARAELSDIHLVEIAYETTMATNLAKTVELAAKKANAQGVANKLAAGAELDKQLQANDAAAIKGQHDLEDAKQKIIYASEQSILAIRIKGLDDQGRFVEAQALKDEKTYGSEVSKLQEGLQSMTSKMMSGGVISATDVKVLDAYLQKLGEIADTEAFNKQAAQVKELNAQFQALTADFAAKTKDLFTYAKANGGLAAAFGAQQLAHEVLSDAIPAVQKLVAAYKAVSGPNATPAEGLAVSKAQKEMQTMLDLNQKAATVISAAWVKTGADISKSLTAAFGSGGTALGGMLAAYTAHLASRTAQDAAYTSTYADVYAKAAAGDQQAQADVAVAEKGYNDSRATDTAGMYASMADSAMGFFKQGTDGYRVMQVVSKAFHLIELAMNMETMVAKLFGTTAVTTAVVASTGVQIAAGATATAASVVDSGVTFAAAAPAAIAKAGAQTGWWGAIAMAAVMAALGYAASGGFDSGGTADAATVQKTQNTGTVLGDVNAKSDSIQKSLDLLGKNSDITLTYTQQMTRSLQAIESSIGGVANIIFRTNGVASGTVNGLQTGTLSKNTGDPILGMFGINDSFLTKNLPIIGGLVSALQGLWGKHTQNVTDSGFTANGTLGQFSQGQGFGQYANVDNTQSSWFGLVKKTTSSQIQGELGPELSRQFGLLFTNLGTEIKLAGAALGLNANTMLAAVNSFAINLPLSIKGLTGTALTDAINNWISTISDTAAQKIIPGLDSFRQVGEGYLQTVVRVATGVEQAKSALDQLGITAINYTQIVNKQGDVMAEIARQSIVAKESVSTSGGNSWFGFVSTVTTGIGKIIEGFAGTGADMITLYTTLISLRDVLKSFGNAAADVTIDMIKGAGSLATLQSGITAYYDKYFTAQEKADAGMASMTSKFDALGVAMPTSLAGFRDLVSGLDLSNVANQTLYGKLMGLSGAFYDATKAVTDIATAANTAAITAATTAAKAFQTTIDKFKSFSAALLTFKDSLLLGNLSTLTPEQKYAEASAQYHKTLLAAQGGDTVAQQALTGSASAFLQASQVANASGTQYQKDFASVTKDMSATSALALTQANLAQLSLNAENAQLAVLNQINANLAGTTVRTVSGTSGGLLPLNGSHANGLSYVPFNGYRAELHQGEAVLTANENLNYQNMGRMDMAPLTNEIKALRAEVAALRADQSQQTGALIAANYDANGKAADKITTGTKEASKAAAWAARSRGAVV